MKDYILKRFTTTVLTCDNPTKTGKIYPKTLIEKSVIENPIITEKLANRVFFCEFPSNDEELDASVNINNVAFSVENLFFEGSELKADVVILNTVQGKILNNLINNTTVAFSCSGVGNIDENNKVTNYELVSIRATVKNRDNYVSKL